VIGSRNIDIINSTISSFTQQNEFLIKQINQLMYYFRGSLGRDDAWALSPIEREIMIEFLNDRIKDAGNLMKKNIPVFI
jgi:hypothetical protein